MDIDEGIFRQDRFRESKQLNIQSKESKVVNPTLRRTPPAEETLIHLMLKDADIARTLKGQIEPEDFTDPLFRRAVQHVFAFLEKTDRLDSGTLLTDGDEELNNLISHYSVLEREYEDPQKNCRDCVELIKQADPEKKMKQIVKALKEADSTGNAEEYKRLLQMQQQLSRRPGRRIPGL